MAEIVRVRAPDGSILTIQAPDGATDEQIEAYAQSVSTGTLYVPEQRPGLPDVTLDPETAARFTPPDVPQVFPRAEARLTPEPSTALHAFPQAMMTEMARAGQGAKAFWNLATWDLPEREQALRTMERLRGEQAERREQFPVPTIAGEVAPYLATPQPLVSSLPRAVATGAALGGVTAGGDPLQTGLGAVGGGAGYALGRALAAPTSQLNPFQQRALAEGRAVGLGATPAQETGGPVLAMLEASLDSNILTQGATGRITAQNQAVANAIAARSIGEASTEIDDLTLGAASQRIGDVFQSIGDKYPKVPVDDRFLDRIARVEDSLIGRITGTDAEEKVRKTISRMMDRIEDESLTGPQITTFSSQLKQDARGLLRGEQGDRQTGRAFNQLANALDDLLHRHASSRDAARLADARTQWRNLVFLENPGVVRGGNVSPRTLANVLRRKAKREYQRGQRQGTVSPTDQLFTLGRYGEAFPPLPQSGTAPRLSVPIAGSALGLGAAATGDLFTGAAVGLGGPAALSMLYRRYPFATGLAGQPASRGPALGGAGARFGIGALPPFGPGGE